MKRLNPDKLHVTYSSGMSADILTLPRRYTLTHSDSTGELFLTIGMEYDKKQISGLYTRLMRDEVLAELINNNDLLEFRIYCYVNGGFVIGPAGWRNKIFRSELPLVLETLRYGDKAFFEQNPDIDNSRIFVHFQSSNIKFQKVENWGTMAKYK